MSRGEPSPAVAVPLSNDLLKYLLEWTGIATFLPGTQPTIERRMQRALAALPFLATWGASPEEVAYREAQLLGLSTLMHAVTRAEGVPASTHELEAFGWRGGYSAILAPGSKHLRHLDRERVAVLCQVTDASRVHLPSDRRRAGAAELVGLCRWMYLDEVEKEDSPELDLVAQVLFEDASTQGEKLRCVLRAAGVSRSRRDALAEQLTAKSFDEVLQCVSPLSYELFELLYSRALEPPTVPAPPSRSADELLAAMDPALGMRALFDLAPAWKVALEELERFVPLIACRGFDKAATAFAALSAHETLRPLEQQLVASCGQMLDHALKTRSARYGRGWMKTPAHHRLRGTTDALEPSERLWATTLLDFAKVHQDALAMPGYGTHRSTEALARNALLEVVIHLQSSTPVGARRHASRRLLYLVRYLWFGVSQRDPDALSGEELDQQIVQHFEESPYALARAVLRASGLEAQRLKRATDSLRQQEHRKSSGAKRTAAEDLEGEDTTDGDERE